MTVLHASAMDGSLETVEWLLQLGADVRATSLEGKTARDLLDDGKHESAKYQDCIKLLSSAEWIAKSDLAVRDYLPLLKALNVEGVHDLADLSLLPSEEKLFASVSKKAGTAEQRRRLFSALKSDSKNLIEDKEESEAQPQEDKEELVLDGSHMQPQMQAAFEQAKTQAATKAAKQAKDKAALQEDEKKDEL